MLVRPGLRLSHAAVLGAFCAGCDDTSDFLDVTITPTEIAVDPADFLGEVPCGASPGALASYVVTLSTFDDEEDTSAFTLGSSIASPCTRAVGFRNVVIAGRRYVAEIDGYDRLAGELQPFGGYASGARSMLDLEGLEVAPRWTGRCGHGAGDATVALDFRRVIVGACDALADAAPTGTAIAFSPADALGEDPCALAASFDILGLSNGMPDALDVACDAEPVVFAAAPDVELRFQVRAETDAGLLGAECLAEAAAGETAAPRCAELTPHGAVRVTLAELADAGEAVCPAGSFFDLFEDDVALNALPLGCATVAQLEPIAPGIHLFDVVVYDGAGAVTRELGCAAEVSPGLTAEALCLP